MTPSQIAALLVGVQRLCELWLSRRNAERLIAEGGQEIGKGHFPILVAIHVAWLAAIAFVIPANMPVYWPVIVAYLVVQAGRYWVVATLGRHWTFKVIDTPDAPLVRGGPYRWCRHPNYVVVVLEVALLPLAFGAWELALLFSAANGAVLAWRLRQENASIERRRLAFD
jgi:methyltransferase